MPLPSPIITTSRPLLQSDLEASLDDTLSASASQAFSELPVPSAYRMLSLSSARSETTNRLDQPTALARIKDAGIEGRLKVEDYGISESALNILIERKREEVQRQEVLSRTPSGVGAGAAQLGTAFATSLLDPLNVGLSFVPVVGEARYAGYLAKARGLIGRTAVRAGVGAAEGAVGAAIAEPLIYAAKAQEQADYDFQDSLLNVAFGTVFGGGLHSIAGGIGDAIGKLREPERETLLRSAVGQAMEGKAVDIEPIKPRGFDSKIPRAESLSEADRVVEHNLAEQIEGDIDGAMRQYGALEDTDSGRVLNTDIARELSPEYRADRTRSAAVHEPASWLVQQMYARKLKEAPAPGQGAKVLFTAGGTGAGKSTGLRLLGDLDQQIIYDTNMNRLAGAVKKIDQALAAGKTVDVVYTWRDPVEALTQGALPRAMRMGRTVPIEAHADTHVGGSKTIKELARKYEKDSRVGFAVIDNSRGKDNAALSNMDVIPDLEYDRVVGDLYAALEAERQANRISEAVYRGTALASSSPRADPRRGDTSPRTEDRGQPEQERTRRQVDAARAVAERQASPEADVTADTRAATTADEQLAAAPTGTDEIATQEALLADELAELGDVARVAGIDLKEELAEFDQAIADAETYGKAARAAALCGFGH